MAHNSYNLAANLVSVLRQADDADGELSDDVLAELERLAGDVPSQIEMLSKVLRVADRQWEALREEVRFLTAQMRKKETRSERLLREIGVLLDAVGETSMDTGAYRSRWRVGNPRIVLDPALASVDTLPAEFVKIEKTVRLEALQKLRAAGHPLPPGVTVEQGRSVQVTPV